MMDERQRHMRKATRLLRSVETRAPSDEPDAVVSTAFYAMYHAACAVLLWHGEALPKTHSSLIGRFGSTVRDLGLDGREAGASLHQAFIRRAKVTMLSKFGLDALTPSLLGIRHAHSSTIAGRCKESAPVSIHHLETEFRPSGHQPTHPARPRVGRRCRGP